VFYLGNAILRFSLFLNPGQQNIRSLIPDRSGRHVYTVPKKCVEWQSPYSTKAAFYQNIHIKAVVNGT
jgi:hypothetical protein